MNKYFLINKTPLFTSHRHLHTIMYHNFSYVIYKINQRREFLLPKNINKKYSPNMDISAIFIHFDIRDHVLSTNYQIIIIQYIVIIDLIQSGHEILNYLMH